MFDEDTRRKLSLVSAQDEVWSDLYGDRQMGDLERLAADTLETAEVEARRSTIEGLQALAKILDARAGTVAGPARSGRTTVSV